MVINIHGTGIELTPAIRSYATEKLEGLVKFFGNIQKVDIDIGKTTNHHKKGEIFYAEANLHIPNHLVRCVKEEVDLYKAIDNVKDHLKIELEKIKGKMRELDKEELRDQKGYQE